MIALIAQGVIFALIVVTLLRHHSNVCRAHARREDLLTNQLLHLTGRTWQEPPREKPEPAKPDPDAGRYTRLPEDFT